MVRVRVRYSGRVQGVGFRATARALALAWPVTGWVRNEDDGTVLLECQGSASAVEGLLGAVRERMGRNIRSEVVEPIEPIGVSGSGSGGARCGRRVSC
ncbi:acylphosphatase [Leptolyngbya sp. 15MV]|nr:acylphosphatase [Leptolyngbya sp. 15MV]